MKLRCTKNTDKHENVTQVCTENLNHPSRCRVRNQRVGIRISIEEPVIEFERTDDQHRRGLYLCWCWSFRHNIRALVFNDMSERYVPTRDRTKATTHRQTRNIPCESWLAYVSSYMSTKRTVRYSSSKPT